MNKNVFKLVSLLIFLLFAITSCNFFHNNSEPIYIKTITSEGNAVDMKNVKTISKITNLSTDYFEVSLSILADKDLYIASKDIEKPSSIEKYKSVSFVISDEKGKNLNFKTSTEFLDFMSKHGYEMVDQNKSEYSTDYTFKKK